MKVLDLFCGAGGASMGLHQAGFEVTGMDINKQPDYPFNFIQADVLSSPLDLGDFDLIWASPPCQAFSTATTPKKGNSKPYPNLIPETREILEASGKPFVIENVPNAPIQKSLVLCGKMFNLKVYRHRHFEIRGIRVEQPRHPPHIWNTWKGEVFTICGDSPMVSGHGDNKLQRRMHREKLRKSVFKRDITKLWQDAMGVYHIKNRRMIAESIPPAYAEYIGKAAIEQLSDIKVKE